MPLSTKKLRALALRHLNSPDRERCLLAVAAVLTFRKIDSRSLGETVLGALASDDEQPDLISMEDVNPQAETTCLVSGGITHFISIISLRDYIPHNLNKANWFLSAPVFAALMVLQKANEKTKIMDLINLADRKSAPPRLNYFHCSASKLIKYFLLWLVITAVTYYIFSWLKSTLIEFDFLQDGQLQQRSSFLKHLNMGDTVFCLQDSGDETVQTYLTRLDNQVKANELLTRITAIIDEQSEVICLKTKASTIAGAQRELARRRPGFIFPSPPPTGLLSQLDFRMLIFSAMFPTVCYLMVQGIQGILAEQNRQPSILPHLINQIARQKALPDFQPSQVLQR